jgi:hypothetical protein
MSKPLIYPKFIGRLGNNLFQIAACIGYAEKYNVSWGIKKGYSKNGFDVFQIDRFFPHLPECVEEYSIYDRSADKHFNYEEIPFFPNGIELVGYFQSLKYFEHWSR